MMSDESGRASCENTCEWASFRMCAVQNIRAEQRGSAQPAHEIAHVVIDVCLATK